MLIQTLFLFSSNNDLSQYEEDLKILTVEIIPSCTNIHKEEPKLYSKEKQRLYLDIDYGSDNEEKNLEKRLKEKNPNIKLEDFYQKIPGIFTSNEDHVFDIQPILLDKALSALNNESTVFYLDIDNTLFLLQGMWAPRMQPIRHPIKYESPDRKNLMAYVRSLNSKHYKRIAKAVFNLLLNNNTYFISDNPPSTFYLYANELQKRGFISDKINISDLKLETITIGDKSYHICEEIKLIMTGNNNAPSTSKADVILKHFPTISKDIKKCVVVDDKESNVFDMKKSISQCSRNVKALGLHVLRYNDNFNQDAIDDMHKALSENTVMKEHFSNAFENLYTASPLINQLITYENRHKQQYKVLLNHLNYLDGQLLNYMHECAQDIKKYNAIVTDIKEKNNTIIQTADGFKKIISLDTI